MAISELFERLGGKPNPRKNKQDRIRGDREVEVVTADGYWVTWQGKLQDMPPGKYAGVHAIERAPYSDRRIDPTLINVVSNEKGVFAATIDNAEFNQRFGFDPPGVKAPPKRTALLATDQWYADNPELDEEEALAMGHLFDDPHSL